MNYLLDTHVVAWFFGDRKKLPKHILARIEDNQNDIFVSPINAYEIGLKFKLNKWHDVAQLAGNFSGLCTGAGFIQLAISVRDGETAADLPLSHRDPFDRLLAAQSIGNGLPILSADPVLDLFGVTRIWA